MIDHELTDPTGSALTITHNVDGVWVTATDTRDEVTVGPFPTRALRASFDMGDDLMDGGVTAAAIENEVVSPERARSLVQERDEATRFAALWKEAARREFQYRVLARTGREFWHGIARKFEESRDAAVQERVDAIARAESARELFHGANLKIVAWRERAEKAEGERDNKAAAYDQLKFLFGNAERAALRWKVRSEKSRPLTADDVTDEMVERAALAEKFVPTTVSHKDLLRGILRAALSDPRPVYSPLLEDDLAAFLDTQEPDTDKGRADWLTARGWRKTGTES